MTGGCSRARHFFVLFDRRERGPRINKNAFIAASLAQISCSHSARLSSLVSSLCNIHANQRHYTFFQFSEQTNIPGHSSLARLGFVRLRTGKFDQSGDSSGLRWLLVFCLHGRHIFSSIETDYSWLQMFM